MNARPPRVRSISIDSFPDCPEEFQSTLEQLLGLLNSFMNDSSTAFEDILGENRNFQIEESVALRTDGSGVIRAVEFQNRLPRKPVGVSVISLVPKSSTASSVSVGAPVWSITNEGRIRINHIGGLAADTEYLANFKVE